MHYFYTEKQQNTVRNALPYVRKWLLPLSWLYGTAVSLRNALFDINILKGSHTRVPCICVGNITVGGTGKTPHTEYLIRLLSQDFTPAMISRGYKRNSRGFILATSESTVAEIGDEARQVKSKFPDLHVAVDANRRRAIDCILGNPDTCDTNVILLDDAFQHRYVRAGLNIVLMDYSRPIYRDMLLPAGRLREPLTALQRADIIVVTKCPKVLTPIKMRLIREQLSLLPHQQLFFSRYRYSTPYTLDLGQTELALTPETSVLLLTGIGNPRQMLREIQHMAGSVTPLAYPDHHDFCAADISDILRRLHQLPTPRLIVTTEKDAARLRSMDTLPDEIRHSTLVLPVRVEIANLQQQQFNNKIISYVRRNQRNSIVAQG